MQLNKEKWNDGDYFNFIQNLKAIAQVKHAEFSSKIIPGAENILGVKIPTLRIMAKEITKGDWAGFLRQAKDNTFEEILIQGIIIGTVHISIEERIKMIEEYLPKINNWALCDCFCVSLKTTGKNKDKMLPLIRKCLVSNNEFTIRFSVVLLLSYYIEGEYIKFVLRTLNEIKNDSYYVKMSVAWAISVCYVKFPSQTEELIGENNLDDFTFNKAIDKIGDSFRVEKDKKRRLKELKRK
jgi:3-methyladenine DNA glycosylase AlkD